jgi:hypothetical protein
MGIDLSDQRFADWDEGTKENCNFVERIGLVDGLRDLLLIRSSSGSELALHGCRVGPAGEYLTAAKVAMADGTDWRVQKVTSDAAEALFRRDAKVVVGEPFGLLLYYPDEDRRVWINLGTVDQICVASL